MLQANDNKHEMTLTRKYKSFAPNIPKREVEGIMSVFCLLLCLLFGLCLLSLLPLTVNVTNGQNILEINYISVG